MGGARTGWGTHTPAPDPTHLLAVQGHGPGYIGVMTERASLVPLVAVALVLSVAAAAVALRTGGPPPLEESGMPSFSDFEVQSAERTVRLSDYRGGVVVVYFGYASCPDICPTTLSTMAAAFQTLSEGQAERVRGLFVSVDPERDPPAHAQEYASFFHPRIVGGTSDAASVARIADDWGIGYERAEGASAAMGYTVDHTSIVFLVAPDGRMKKAMPHGSAPDVLAAAIVDVMGDASE